MTVFSAALAEAASSSGVALGQRIGEACCVHFDLLLRWNHTHNLTRIVDPAEAARKHYLDCLVPLLALRAAGLTPSLFVDVGSGAGFPGLLAALVWPGAAATLWEPARKRLSFLVLAASAMGLRVTAEEPPEVRSPSAAAGSLPLSEASAGLVLSRATFSEGKRGELLRPAGNAIAVWGHPEDCGTWKKEVATWPGWHAAAQKYQIAGLESRSILWALRGEFHVEHIQSI